MNLLLEVTLFRFEQRVFKHTFAFALMQMCACLKQHMRKVNDYVFCALCMVCPGSAVSWNRQDCNRQSMQRVQITWSIGTALCQNAKHMSKGLRALTAKPATAFPEIVYITVIVSYVSASNCSTCDWLLFFRWFPHGKSAACKKLPD